MWSCGGGVLMPDTEGRRTPHYRSPYSECFKPFEHGRVCAPQGRLGGVESGGARLRERLSFHVEIDGAYRCVVVTLAWPSH